MIVSDILHNVQIGSANTSGLVNMEKMDSDLVIRGKKMNVIEIPSARVVLKLVVSHSEL